MNSGVLQFTLGLGTGGFLSALGPAGAAVKGFIGSMVSVGAMVEGVMSVIGRGAALEHLSKRTGETRKDLYMLEKGFIAVGLSAEDVGPAIFTMQKSLGGVNEMGQKTADIFKRMGLNAATLKHAGGKDAMEAILTSISKMNQSDAAKAASSIFGRSQGANMVQAARSMEEMKEAMLKAQPAALVFDRLAKAFEAIEKSIKQLKDKWSAFFLGVTSAIAPLMQGLLDLANKINALKIGEKVGNMVRAVIEAFKEGKMVDLFSAGIEAGVEFAVNVISGTLGSGAYWAGLWQVMTGEFKLAVGVIGKLFLSLGDVLTAALDTAFQNLFAITAGPRFQALLRGIAAATGSATLSNLADLLAETSGAKPKTFKENFAARQAEAGPAQEMLNGLVGSGAKDMVAGAKMQMDAVALAIANSGGPAQERFKALYAGLVGRFKDVKKEEDEPPPLDKKLAPTTTGYKPEFTSLEKMGFIMSGIGNPSLESQRLTAENTSKLVSQNQQIIGLLGGKDDADPVLDNG